MGGYSHLTYEIIFLENLIYETGISRFSVADGC